MPSFLAMRPRWKAYAGLPFYQRVDDIEVYRPAIAVIPGFMSSFWSNEMASLMVGPLARKLHAEIRFDAILSFDLSDGGGVAWRLGRNLRLPAAGWATGDDIRINPQSVQGRKVIRTLNKLDLVFYQSRELMNISAGLLRLSPETLEQSGRHYVLARGVTGAQSSSEFASRRMTRAALSIKDDEIMVLFVGRMVRDKGIFGLIEVFAKNIERAKHLRLVLLGSNRAFDHSDQLEAQIGGHRTLAGRVTVMPACSPEKVFDCLRAADIFAFPSMKEGMPNALLEAMQCGLPAVTFRIPAVCDLLRYDQMALAAVAPFDYDEFFDALTLLSENAELRQTTGGRGKQLVMDHFCMSRNLKVVLNHLSELAGAHTIAV